MQSLPGALKPELPEHRQLYFYDKELPLAAPTFELRLSAVEERIQRAVERSGRQRSDVTLVAVSKKFSADRIREAYQAGLRDFGENYVQEFAEKQPHLKDLQGARFHLIGHLQSNKTRQACELFQVLQTIDSAKLLQRLDAAAAEHRVTPELFIEVKLSAEESKSGVEPQQLPELLDVAAACSTVRVNGLMAMPPWSQDAEQSRPYFRRLAELARRYALPGLSMGMSNDFEAAVEEGATLIRVGTALFGSRPKPQPAASPGS